MEPSKYQTLRAAKRLQGLTAASRFLMMCFLSLLSFATTASWAQITRQTVFLTDVSYGNDPSQRLDACLPARGRVRAPGAVVMIHGGGWFGGDKQAFDKFCQMSAENGLTAVSINYRLVNGSPAHEWPAQVDDLTKALRYLRNVQNFAPLEEFENVCLLGNSAGGQIAAYFSVTDGSVALRQTGQKINLRCLVDNFGAVDLTLPTGHIRNAICRLLGAPNNPAECAVRQRAASPLYQVSPRAAPTLAVQGTNDSAVPMSETLAFVDALQRENVPAQIKLYDGEHEFRGISTQEHTALLQQEIDFMLSELSFGR